VLAELRVAGVQIRIVQVTLEHALLQAVRHGHVRDAAVEGEHAPMTAEPVAALHVLGRPGEQQLAEAEPATNTYALWISPVFISYHSIGSPA
jgi:hypothetical protein